MLCGSNGRGERTSLGRNPNRFVASSCRRRGTYAVARTLKNAPKPSIVNPQNLPSFLVPVVSRPKARGTKTRSGATKLQIPLLLFEPDEDEGGVGGM